MFHVALYYNQDTQRKRWAVLCSHSQVWYFAERYGRKEAEKLKQKLLKV